MKNILFAIILLFSISEAGAATYYIDYNAADNTANGTTSGTPWKVAPGMVGCDGNCASYSHSSGDIFVFKGGVTWPATCFPMVISYSGSSSSVMDKYTSDEAYYTGGSFTLPIFQGAPLEYEIDSVDGYDIVVVGSPFTADQHNKMYVVIGSGPGSADKKMYYIDDTTADTLTVIGDASGQGAQPESDGAADGDLISINGYPIVDVYDQDYVWINGIAFDGGSTPGGTHPDDDGTWDGLRIVAGTGHKVTNCTFDDIGALETVGCTYPAWKYFCRGALLLITGTTNGNSLTFTSVGNLDYATVSGNTFDDVTTGILLLGTSPSYSVNNCTVTENIITSAGYVGICLEDNTRYCTVSYNTLSSIGDDTLFDCWGQGLNIHGRPDLGWGMPEYNTFEWNTVDDVDMLNTTTPGDGDSGIGLRYDDASRYNIARYNTIKNTESCGILISNIGTDLIYCNRIFNPNTTYSNSGGGISIYYKPSDLSGLSQQPNWVINNTVVTGTVAPAYEYVAASAWKPVSFFYNNIGVTGDKKGLKVGLYPNRVVTKGNLFQYEEISSSRWASTDMPDSDWNGTGSIDADDWGYEASHDGQSAVQYVTTDAVGEGIRSDVYAGGGGLGIYFKYNFKLKIISGGVTIYVRYPNDSGGNNLYTGLTATESGDWDEWEFTTLHTPDGSSGYIEFISSEASTEFYLDEVSVVAWKESATQQIDALLVDGDLPPTEGTDYSLLSTSPARNGGFDFTSDGYGESAIRPWADSTMATDMNGNSWAFEGYYDIGAYEFIGPCVSVDLWSMTFEDISVNPYYYRNQQ